MPARSRRSSSTGAKPTRAARRSIGSSASGRVLNPGPPVAERSSTPPSGHMPRRNAIPSVSMFSVDADAARRSARRPPSTPTSWARRSATSRSIRSGGATAVISAIHEAHDGADPREPAGIEIETGPPYLGGELIQRQPDFDPCGIDHDLAAATTHESEQDLVAGWRVGEPVAKRGNNAGTPLPEQRLIRRHGRRLLFRGRTAIRRE